MIDLMLFVEYALWGLVGAFAHLLVMSMAWRERVYVLREIGFAVVIAFVISQLGLPNEFSTFGLAFMGVDAMEAFLRRLVGKNES